MAKEVVHFRREVMTHLIRAFYSDDFPEGVGTIVFDMRPKGYSPPTRCCIYHDRAVIRSRVIAALGFGDADDDERTSTADYAKSALDRSAVPSGECLTLLGDACYGCEGNHVLVTELCHNCVAKPCIDACHFGAISPGHGRSIIDKDKCKRCGLCVKACPYTAIRKEVVPCELACPARAITKKDDGRALIDFTRCIFCGHCLSACPFGAINIRSQVVDVLSAIKGGRAVVALAAPSFFAQFSAKPGQLAAALEKLGFSRVEEVARGADETASHEASEWAQRMAAKEPFMTTSCCAAYNEWRAKHVPELAPFASKALTPMGYTARSVRQTDPDAVLVFIGPCVAKYKEAFDSHDVDYIVTFEEIECWMVAMGVDPSQLPDSAMPSDISAEARGFGETRGVSKAVVSKGAAAAPVFIDGLDEDAMKSLKAMAKTRICDGGNLVEVMSCKGGCVGGGCAIRAQKAGHR